MSFREALFSGNQKERCIQISPQSTAFNGGKVLVSPIAFAFAAVLQIQQQLSISQENGGHVPSFRNCCRDSAGPFAPRYGPLLRGEDFAHSVRELERPAADLTAVPDCEGPKQ
jgi:hypothetical protein